MTLYRRRSVFMSRAAAFGLALLALAGEIACASSGGTQLRVPSAPRGHTQREATSVHWRLPPDQAEQAFAHGALQIVSDRHAGRGLTGARRFEVELVDVKVRVTAKWKPMPQRLDGINNSPRKELAAYQLQKLFLDPGDYVVPTSAPRCLEAADFQAGMPHSIAATRESHCELGILSLWLEELTLPDAMLELTRFERDPLYAAALADFNLVTYLMKHQDGRRGNFLVAVEPNRPRVFAVDNGVAWSGIFYNWFVPNWKKIRVPALRRASIERLRELTLEDVASLGIVAQLELDEEGRFVNVAHTQNLDPDEGVRVEGSVIQLGLDDDEVEDLWERIVDLIEDVDRGVIATF